MRRLIWLGLVAAVAGAGAGLLAISSAPEWTTSSPEALDSFEAAVCAQMRLRTEEVAEHLEQALAHDPGFVVAKVMLAENLGLRDPERSAQLFTEAAEAPLDGLSPREQFLVRRGTAIFANQLEAAQMVLEQAVVELEDDPFVLLVAAEEQWQVGDFASAELLYRRLIAASPNWVIAYNNLGYLAMLQGRFSEAEELFTTYRFIAPEQANPHDSLGELLVILGHPAEACESFERALEIWPEFDQAVRHLAVARTLLGEREEAAEVLRRARQREICRPACLHAMDCEARYLGLLLDRDWFGIEIEDAEPCINNPAVTPFVALVVHRALCERGRYDAALALEQGLGEAIAKRGRPATILDDDWEPYLIHMRGVRLALAGKRPEAIDHLEQADERWSYLDSLRGVLKLHNRLILVRLLEAEGRSSEAGALLDELEPTAPSLIASFRSLGLETLDPLPVPAL